jgi:hypothetical protein
MALNAHADIAFLVYRYYVHRQRDPEPYQSPQGPSQQGRWRRVTTVILIMS